MVDREVQQRVTDIVRDLFPGIDPAAIDYLFRCRLLDINKCRIAVIKKHYRDLVGSGVPASDAKALTGEKFCRSENTIHNIIYNEYYRDIKF